MKHHICLLSCLFILFWANNAPAQTTKTLTIEEAAMGLRGKLAVQNLSQLACRPNTNQYTFVANNCLVAGQANSTKSNDDTLLKAADLELLAMPLLSWQNENTLYFNNNGTIKTYHIPTKKLNTQATINENAQNDDIEPNTLAIAYTIDNNLLVNKNGKEITLTNEKNKNIVSGQSVHRNEFGITKGTFWSPKGNLLAFYKMDETMVTDYPILNTESKPATVKNIKYPMAGMTSHEVTIGIFNTTTQKTIYLQTGTPAKQYLTNISWFPNEQSIAVAIVNPEQNQMSLNQYNTQTGQLEKILFTEKNEKYIEPEHGLIFLPTKPNEFLWLSERDGYNHLYHYNAQGKLINQISSGNFNILNIAGFDDTSENIFITATKDQNGNLGTEENPFSINLKTKKINPLSQIGGTHTLQTNGIFCIDAYTNATTPRQINTTDTKGKTIKTILIAQNPLQNYTLATVQNITLKASDGTPLYGKLMRPDNFDSTKKYPLIVYVYGGPHLQLIKNRFPESGNLWYDYMTSKGYLIFSMDNRGSANRSLAFEQAVHKNLGTTEMQDQMTGIEYLKTLPFIDQKRMGVHGWSFGGFMTTSLLSRQANTFKVGVAGGAVVDWNYYEVMYTERYMDTPTENPQGYNTANTLNYVDNLKDKKLLLIHGTTDDVVVWQHTLLYLKKCVERNILVDYLVYPEHAHNVQGKDRIHLMKKISQYFIDNL